MATTTIDELNQMFRPIAGRDTTEWERSWAGHSDPQNAYGGVEGALRWQAERLANVANKIRNIAQSQGYNLTPEEAIRMRDMYMPTTGSSSDSEIADAIQLATNAIGTKFQQQANQDQGNLETTITGAIDKIQNPEKYLDPSVTSGNVQTAAGYLRQLWQREPTDDEVNYFASQLNSGMKPYELVGLIKSTPEYIQHQTALQQAQEKATADEESKRIASEASAAREQLNQDLLRQEEEAFRRATPEILASFQRSGRLNSSGIDSALAKARADLASQRQAQMANAGFQDAAAQRGYRREDFLNRQNTAYQDYLRAIQASGNFANYGQSPISARRDAATAAGIQSAFQDPYSSFERNYNFGLGSLNRQYGLADQARQRQNDIEDYYRQMNDYNRYASDARRQANNNAWMQLLGTGIGAGIQGATYRMGR